MNGRRNLRAWRRAGVGLVASALVAVLVPLAVPAVADPSSTSTSPVFRLVARVPSPVVGNWQPRMLLDNHRRAYQLAQVANHPAILTYNIDALGQNVSTVAGTGTAGSSGVAGQATSAELNQPSGLAFDKAGNLFIADAANNRIRKVDVAGNISTVAGTGAPGFSGDGGPASSAGLNHPSGLLFDSAGNLLIADTASNRIRQVDSAGNISTVAGTSTAGFSGDTGPATSAELNQPSALAIDSAGNLLIADTANNRIRQVDSGGTITTFAGNGTAGYSGDQDPNNPFTTGVATSAELNRPSGLAFDTSWNLFIADTANNRIRMVNGTTITTAAGNGVAGFSGDRGPATSAALNGPVGIAIDPYGNLSIADVGNDRVRNLMSAGMIVTAAGTGAAGSSGDGGPPVTAQLNGPTGVAFDQTGNMYVSEAAGSRVRRVDGAEARPRLRLSPGKQTTQAFTMSMADGAPVTAIDSGSANRGSRIFFYGSGIVYEVETDSPDPANPMVHAWGAVGSSAIPTSSPPINQPNTQATVNAQTIGLMSALAMSYDPGGTGPSGPSGAITYPRTLYMVGQTGAGNRQVVLTGWDASPGTSDFRAPETRLKWAYVVRSCGDIGAAQSLVFRAGDWLYTFCRSYTDNATKGVLRVKLSASGVGTPGFPAPDPTSEEFFPGVTGSNVVASADPATERVYLANDSGGTRNITVFDGRASCVAWNAQNACIEGRGAYTGEIAISRSSTSTPAKTLAGVDPTTGRWYLRSPEGLWYQDGRGRRVGQAHIGNPSQAIDSIAADDTWEIPCDSSPQTKCVDLSSTPSLDPQVPIAVDPAVLDSAGKVLRPARLFVTAPAQSVGRCGGVQCFEVFEDNSPLAGAAPSPDEATLNVPEGPGLTGVYDGVASSYGVRFRLMRGLSSGWPSGVPLTSASLEQPPPDIAAPRAAPSDYTTDPFFYYSHGCGLSDRELTFGRVRQSTLHGDLSFQDAGATALGVDPDVIRPSAGKDESTRIDLKSPDRCLGLLLQTMTNPVCQNPIGQAWQDKCQPNADAFWASTHPSSGSGPDWPWGLAHCLGDDKPPTISGPGATADVACAATADTPGVTAGAHAQLSPAPAAVSVQSTDATTQIIRHPGHGIESVATSVVKGIDIAGTVHIDEMVMTATTKAEGYATAAGTTARTEFHRDFFGLSVAGNRVCAHCSAQDVVDVISKVLGPLGYARAADPEPDTTLGTVKGTLSVLQKDLLLQDADGITNHDYSTEVPGLEIVFYRDGTTRGRGRWEVQLGGVFSQAQFGVVTALTESKSGGGSTGNTSRVLPRFIPGITRPGHPGVAAQLIALGSGDLSPATAKMPGSIINRIIKAWERSLKAALLVAALAALVYAPVYVARRRLFLHDVMSQT